MDFYYRLFFQNLFLFLAILFISVFFYLVPLFTFIPTLFLRLRRGHATLNDNSEFFEVLPEEKQFDNVKVEQELEPKFEDFEKVDSDKNDDKEKTEFCFKFKFPTYEEFSKDKTETGELIASDFVPEKSFSSLIQEPEIVNLNAEEIGCTMKDVFDLDEEDRKEVPHHKMEGIQEEEEHTGAPEHHGYQKEIEGMDFLKGESDSVCKQFLGDSDFPDEFLFQSEKDSSGTDSDTVSVGFEHMRSLMSRLVNSYSDGFLSDEDFGGEFELDPLNDIDSDLKNLDLSEENHESEDFEDSDSDIMEELRELEQEDQQNDSEFLSQDDIHEDLGMVNTLEFVTEDDKLINGPQESENPKSINTAIVDTCGDANKLESLWEHQELIEQLKMEIRKVRATGLPTILEESESPTMDELQPWKIDEMLHREDSMSELHKFYKSYREKMRKFDILTYQKMYAIGYLQKDPLKDPLQLLFNQKSSGPTLKSLLSQNIRLFKHRSHDIDPMVRFIKEMQSDLEVVYVGQMCLSWEFLHWQYMKALNLWDSDPRGIRKYNEVAGEFQQFQVLMQRFIENEAFQGPRVQYFIKSRYDLRNLLQVPVIRDDRVKDRNKARTKEKAVFSITSDMLVEILEESIRIFWRFVKADKDCYSVMTKGQKGIHPEVQEQEDMELFLEIKKNLEKKEKKLQEVLRSGNCILRKFRKNREDDSDHVLYFFSQVDVKLVARVLNMSRLTKDQLVWCHNKLSRISFVHRKIHVEPSFLLFPC